MVASTKYSFNEKNKLITMLTCFKNIFCQYRRIIKLLFRKCEFTKSQTPHFSHQPILNNKVNNSIRKAPIHLHDVHCFPFSFLVEKGVGLPRQISGLVKTAKFQMFQFWLCYSFQMSNVSTKWPGVRHFWLFLWCLIGSHQPYITIFWVKLARRMQTISKK